MSKKKNHDDTPEDASLPLQLGVEVRDLISGVKGIVTLRAENLSGVVQWAVQPRTDDGKWADSVFIDGPTLDVIGRGLLDRIPELDSPVNIALGDKVRDIVTRRTGIATERVESFNGCVQFRVEGKAGKTFRTGMIYVVDHKRLLLLDAGAVAVEGHPTGAANRRTADVTILKETQLG